MKSHRLLIINPGSTSTKISVFENRKELFTQSIFHDAPVLLQYPTVNDQIPFRISVTEQILNHNNCPMESIDVFVGRGGSAWPQKSGVMPIDQKLYDDTWNEVGGSQHAAKLGVLMAWTLAQKYHKPAYTMNATNVDELSDVARITGIKGLYRRAQTHTLNQKATADIYAKGIGKKYEDLRAIVCHIDGGITVTCHCGGQMIDSTEGAGGDGAFSPTRIGSLSVSLVLQQLKKSPLEELEKTLSRSGGFVSHFGTSDAKKVSEMVQSGDQHAKLVWEAMNYQICKCIGEMACVLEGKVDVIILTGGLVRYDSIVNYIKEHCEWIAPVAVYPGEVEQEALAYNVMDVLEGTQKAHPYTGEPVFKGFDWDR